jgi:hypothetical protein
MALKANEVSTGSNFKKPDPLEPGAYPARVVQVISLGLQKQQPYAGEEKPPKHELYVTYEILDEFLLDEDGEEIKDKPRWISERFGLHNLDSDMAKSTKRYFALDPENEYGGDWEKIPGSPCIVNIINNKAEKGKHKGKVFDKVGSVSAMRAKEANKAKELVNPPKIFDIDAPDMEVFYSLPDWLQKIMTEENLEFEGSALDNAIKAYKKADKKDEPKDEPEVDNDDEDDDGEDW